MIHLLEKEERKDFCVNKLIPLVKRVSDQCITESFEVEKKSQGNFVTTIDKKIEQSLMTELEILLPESGFITEETGWEEKEKYNWIIDPIDGTTNFIYGLTYTVSVALAYGAENKILIGIVYSPQNGLLYYGCKDSGSFLIENQKTTKLSVRMNQGNEGIAIFGMPYDRRKTDKIFDIAKKIYAHASDLKRIGPSSMDICLVAAGKAKVYFELDLNIWDISAGLLILSEAGGKYEKRGDLFIFGSEESIALFEKMN